MARVLLNVVVTKFGTELKELQLKAILGST